MTNDQFRKHLLIIVFNFPKFNWLKIQPKTLILQISKKNRITNLVKNLFGITFWLQPKVAFYCMSLVYVCEKFLLVWRSWIHPLKGETFIRILGVCDLYPVFFINPKHIWSYLRNPIWWKIKNRSEVLLWSKVMLGLLFSQTLNITITIWISIL